MVRYAKMRSVVRLLVRSCHPAPCIAVTVFATVLSVLVDNTAGTTVLLAAAILAGQLSIGWSNDRIDAARDARAGRRDKPLATGDAPRRAVDVAIVVSLGATVALSLALGVWPGVTHLLAVAWAWSYNLVLKATWFSWLPFAVAFGSLPAIATLALPGHPAPALWVLGAGALLGVAAHLTNVVPDIEDDRATEVVGFAHRIGARASLLLATVLLAAASVLIVLGPPGAPSALDWAGLTLVIALAIAALALGRTSGRVPFYAIISLVALDLLLLVLDRSPSDFLLH
jgi:4-hydroxybenzoate polyprenyltransferase